MAKTLTQLYTDLNAILRDETSGRIDNDDRKRAINQAIDELNGEGSYKFQVETENISNVVGTYSYTPTLRNFKAVKELKTPVASPYRRFAFVDEEYFNQKVYNQHSSEAMYTISEIAGTRRMLINHYTTETLTCLFFSDNMVLAADGTTRNVHFDAIGDTLLMPDRHAFVVVYRAAKILWGSFTSENTDDRTDSENEYKVALARFNKEYKFNTPKETRRLRVRVPNYSTSSISTR